MENKKRQKRKVKINRKNNSGAKRVRVNPWILAGGIILFIFVIFAISVITGSKPKQTDSFSKAKGEWILDCRYVDAKAVTIPQTKMVMTDNSMVVTTYKEQNAADEPAEGEGKSESKDAAKDDVDVNQNKNETVIVEDVKITYSIKGSNGKITASSDTGTVEYEFLYDKGAEILHMYSKDANGSVVHEVYRHETEAGK